MEKKVESAYIYLDYRLLLNDDFILRSDINSRYSLRAYARDLNLSPTFLSEVLRGKKELSLQNCSIVFAKIGLSGHELEYAENLVTSKNSKLESVRLGALENIRSWYTGKEYIHESSKDLLVKSLPHFVIFGLMRKIQSKKKILKMAETLGIDSAITLEVIQDYLDGQYIYLHDDEVKVMDENFTLKNHEKLVDISSQFNFLLHSQIKKDGGTSVPDRVCHSLVLGVSEETYLLITEAHKHFIKTIHRLSDQDKVVERIVFISDAFYRMPELIKASEEFSE